MQRIRFFDIAKGIAILAVILGHSAIETNLFAPHRTAQVVLSICFSFHMPLFYPVRVFHASRQTIPLDEGSKTAAAHLRGDGIMRACRRDLHGDARS